MSKEEKATTTTTASTTASTNAVAPVALITAAGKGIGAEIARELVNRNYKVVLMSPSDNCINLAKELNGVAYKGSVTNKDDLKAVFDLAISTYGRIDVLVNNTGHPPKNANVLNLSDEEFDKAHEMVLKNVVRLARLVTPVFQQQKTGGSIINISSIAAIEPNSLFPLSSVYRAALSSFTKLYADQNAKYGIRMNCVLPGYVDSYQLNDVSIIPAGRIAKVSEIAKTVAFLASNDGAYITGQSIKVDGGLSKSY